MLVVLFRASHAHADATAEAKAKFDDGAAAFTQRQYARAAEAYEEAARLSPHPAPLINAAEAWELDGNFVRAARSCDAVLELAATLKGSTDAQVLSQTEKRLARVLRRVSTLEVEGPETLIFQMDQGEYRPPPALLRLAPGAHSIALAVPSTGATRKIDLILAAGVVRHLVLDSALWSAANPGDAQPPAKVDVSPRSGSNVPPVGTWVAFGIGAATGIGTAIFGVRTLDAQDDFNASPTNANADRFEQNRTFTNVLLGVTGAAVVVGAAIWIFTPKSKAASAFATPLRFSF